MFRFGKTAKSQNPPGASEAADLLAASEAAEFEASVLMAKARREEAPPPVEPAREPADAEIVWEERSDVYAPTPVDAEEFIGSLGLPRPPEIVFGRTILLIRRDAFAKVQAHLRSDTAIELGGLLVGRALYDAGRACYVIVIEAAMPAADGYGTATYFEYTAASWEALTPQLQEMASDWTVIGSYHSHPGVGVFLSQTDLDTQANIFSHDWQIALVIDPITEEIGFFVGVGGMPCLHWQLL